MNYISNLSMTLVILDELRWVLITTADLIVNATPRRVKVSTESETMTSNLEPFYKPTI